MLALKENTQYLALNHNRPDDLIGTLYCPVRGCAYEIVGWARTDMTDAGQRWHGMGKYETPIVLKLDDGRGHVRRVHVTLISVGRF
jgi:hypothetical protein